LCGRNITIIAFISVRIYAVTSTRRDTSVLEITVKLFGNSWESHTQYE